MSKIRVTAHNGRKGKNGVFSPKHNDRKFVLTGAEHIDPTKTKNNVYWYFCMEDTGECDSFEEHELKYYTAHFEADRKKKNENPIKNRQYSRVKTMKQYILSPKNCPEETIIQIGKAEDREKPDPETLSRIFDEYTLWHKLKYPRAVFLDAAMHLDEPNAAYHIHLRKVWVAHKDGMEIVNQRKSLEEMGVERPFPDKPNERHNNAKITYTLDCREKLIELGKKYGFDIEETPKAASKVGLEKLEYERRQEEMKIEKLRCEAAALTESIKEITEKVAKAIVPERVGIFQHKTGNMVMNEDTYNQVIEAVYQKNAYTDKIVKNSQVTKENEDKAIEARQKAELSAYRQELAIREAALKMLEENNREESEAKEEARRDRDEIAKIKKKTYAIIKKAVKDVDSNMKNYFAGQQLADGRNALEAFAEDNAKHIRSRLEMAEMVHSGDGEVSRGLDSYTY